MKFALFSLFVVLSVHFAAAAPVDESRFDLSSIMHLLKPENTTAKPGILGALSSLTHGTSLQQALQMLQLLNNLHQIQGQVQAIPNDIISALNQTASLIGDSAGNLTNILVDALHGNKTKTVAVEDQRFDLSSIMHILKPETTTAKPGILGALSSLTHGTSLQQALQMLQLLNNLHQIQGQVQAIPNDIISALNQTASLIGDSAGNLTNILVDALHGNKTKTVAVEDQRFDLSSIMHILKPETTTAKPGILGALSSLTHGTSLQQALQMLQLLNNLHQIQGQVQAIPNDIVTALNQTASLIGNSAGNLTNILVDALHG